MSESYPIRALAARYGVPYGDMLMVADCHPLAVDRHQRDIRLCEDDAWDRVFGRLSLIAWGELIERLKVIELKAQGRAA